MTEQMKDVDHTHPHMDSAFGTAFTRGPAVAADGGHEADETTETMADVDHGSSGDGVDRAYERGTEGRDETV
jgi:hypothetical protein